MKKVFLILSLCFFSVTLLAQSKAVRIKEFNLENKVAVQGYDVITYFTQSKAVLGKKEIAAVYDGVIYYFANQAEKEQFLKSPASYEPQYGGWCAYAMGAKGEKVTINPETFKIIDGKLNLFYNAFFNNTLKSWNKDQANLKKSADNNWKNFIN